MCAVAWPNAFDSGERMLKLTTSAPPLRRSRRVKPLECARVTRPDSIGMSSALRACLERSRRALDRPDDPQVAAAAAEHPGERALDVGVAPGPGLVRQELRRHQ